MKNQNKIKRKVSILLTPEEGKYFSKIFNILDYEKVGKISSDSAAYFMRNSGLNTKLLKEIYLSTSHKDKYFIERNEFFIILRLIALAQNNIPFTQESLENNNPIPPFPKFNFFQKENLIEKSNPFEITKEIEDKYLSIFSTKKDTKADYISKLRTILILHQINPKINSENIIKSLQPLKLNGYLDSKEFIVACYLFFLSEIIKMPIKLPQYLLNYLGRNSEIKTIKNDMKEKHFYYDVYNINVNKNSNHTKNDSQNNVRNNSFNNKQNIKEENKNITKEKKDDGLIKDFRKFILQKPIMQKVYNSPYKDKINYNKIININTVDNNKFEQIKLNYNNNQEQQNNNKNIKKGIKDENIYNKNIIKNNQIEINNNINKQKKSIKKTELYDSLNELDKAIELLEEAKSKEICS